MSCLQPMLTPGIIILGILRSAFTPKEASVIGLSDCMVIFFFVYRTVSLTEILGIVREMIVRCAKKPPAIRLSIFCWS